MSKVRIRYEGREIVLDVKQGQTIEVSLDNLEVDHPVRTAMKVAGINGRKLYRYMCLNSKDGGIFLECAQCEEETGISTIALGRTLSSLEKEGLLKVKKKKKDSKNRIIEYDVQMLSIGKIKSEVSVMDRNVEEIEQALGAPSKRLYQTLVREASVDGTIILGSVKELMQKMTPRPDLAPTFELKELERGDWIKCVDNDDCLVISVIGWDLLNT